MLVHDDNYIIRARQAGVPVATIAAKLNMTVEQVEKRWRQILKDVESKFDNGYLDLCQAFHTLSGQYQLVGSSLGIIAQAIGNVIPDEDLKKLITTDPEQTFKNLKANTILLKVFIPITPEEAIEKDLKKN